MGQLFNELNKASAAALEAALGWTDCLVASTQSRCKHCISITNCGAGQRGRDLLRDDYVNVSQAPSNNRFYIAGSQKPLLRSLFSSSRYWIWLNKRMNCCHLECYSAVSQRRLGDASILLLFARRQNQLCVNWASPLHKHQEAFTLNRISLPLSPPFWLTSIFRNVGFVHGPEAVVKSKHLTGRKHRECKNTLFTPVQAQRTAEQPHAS